MQKLPGMGEIMHEKILAVGLVQYRLRGSRETDQRDRPDALGLQPQHLAGTGYAFGQPQRPIVLEPGSQRTRDIGADAKVPVMSQPLPQQCVQSRGIGGQQAFTPDFRVGCVAVTLQAGGKPATVAIDMPEQKIAGGIGGIPDHAGHPTATQHSHILDQPRTHRRFSPVGG